MSLPKSKHRSGYTEKEIEAICKEKGIDIQKFWVAFGVNTCMIDEDNNEVIHYHCDVEKALWQLRDKDGKYHPWD